MKSKDQLLLEEAYKQIWLIAESKKQAQQFVDQGKLPKEDFDKIVSIDQTPTKKYVGWMAKQWISKNVNNIAALKTVVTKLDQLIAKNSKNLKPEYKDFSNKTFKQIKDAVEQAENDDKATPSLKVKSKEYTTLLDNNDLIIVIPHSFEAAKKLGRSSFSYRECRGGGKDSAWCVTHDLDYWREHEDGVLYFVKIKSEKMLNALAKAGMPDEYSVMALKLIGVGNRITISGTDAENAVDDEHSEQELKGYFNVTKIKPMLVDHFNKNYKNAKPDEASVKKWLKRIADYVEGRSEAGNDLTLNRCPLEEIPSTLKIVEGSLDLQNTKFLKKLPDNLTVKYDMQLGNSSLTKLPNNLTIGSNLFVFNAAISTFPSDLKVKGNIFISDDNPLYGKMTSKELSAMYPKLKFVKL